MWINKIHVTLAQKSDANLPDITERTVKVLQQYQFLTEIKENKISFQRSIQFTTDSGNNRWQVFLYNYNGELEISESDGIVVKKISLNINAHLFKSVFLIIMIGLFLYLFKAGIAPYIYLGLSMIFILIQRALIKMHFIGFVAHKENYRITY